LGRKRIITHSIVPLGAQVRSGEVLVKLKIEGGDGTCISSILGPGELIGAFLESKLANGDPFPAVTTACGA